MEAMLRPCSARAVAGLEMYPPPKNDEAHLTASDRQRYEEALRVGAGAARGLRRGGSVESGATRANLDGEPAVGLSLRVFEVGSKRGLVRVGDTLEDERERQRRRALLMDTSSSNWT